MPKTSAKELAARKERARLHDEHRQWMEAQIAKLEKQGLSTEKICDELGLFTVENPPAKQFILDRLKGVDVANVDDALHREMVDLLRSDIADINRHICACISPDRQPVTRHCHKPKGRLGSLS